MIAGGGGNIINIGSICSVRHFPSFATYVGAKFGVLGFSRSLYEEVREKGIRVNCLCPAAVNTEWAGLAGAELPWAEEERLQPEDLAELALLCVTMPKRVQLEQIMLWPVCEATA
jgi:short-subunit dehydrogenase